MSLPSPRRNHADRAFALLLGLGAAWVLYRHHPGMDAYTRVLLPLATLALIALGWHWRALQRLTLAAAALALAGVWHYQAHLLDGQGLAHTPPAALRYLLASHSATAWMGLLYLLSTLCYWLGLLGRGHWQRSATLGAALAWAGSALALAGTLVRWYESHLLGHGHIPVSNLYEVLILFCWLTTLLMLYYEARWHTRSIGPFAMLPVCAAIGFLLWYSLSHQAHTIEPLVPALQSGWMQWHVPANLIGYGAFAMAAMAAFARLLQSYAATATPWRKLTALGLLGLALCLTPLLMQHRPTAAWPISPFWLAYSGTAALIVTATLGLRQRIAPRLPTPAALDALMHQAIATGFVFFTIATILGAFWAAQAWGSYWSWDPKETWALIVWLNYAAWLHLRLSRPRHDNLLAWWALLGLALTAFAFLGVNLLLPGMHSYGQL